MNFIIRFSSSNSESGSRNSICFMYLHLFHGLYGIVQDSGGHDCGRGNTWIEGGKRGCECAGFNLWRA